jgi:hypothetical protein
MTNTEQILYVLSCAVFALVGCVVAHTQYVAEIMSQRQLLNEYEETIERLNREKYEETTPHLLTGKDK